MRLLFEIDRNDYARCTRTFRRDSARAVIIKDGSIAMIHSLRYDHYKFPGGGIEDGEDPVHAMMRETREETGLIVIPESVREYGYVHRIQKSDIDPEECFVQDNYYYLCEVADEMTATPLEDYEKEGAYKLEYADPAVAIKKNREAKSNPYHLMLEREARVLENLIADGLL